MFNLKNQNFELKIEFLKRFKVKFYEDVKHRIEQ